MAIKSLPTDNHRKSRLKYLFQIMIAPFTTILEEKSSTQTVKVLDGIRAIALLTVIMYHLCVKANIAEIPWLPHAFTLIIYTGYIGVTLFFVLSGFLLFLPYCKALLSKADWPSLRLFYLRRTLRIVPAYYLTLFLLIILAKSEYLQPDHWKELLLFFSFFMDSSSQTFQKLDAPFWSLAVEWQFYLLLPWLALAIRAIVQRGSLQWRFKKLCLCLCLLISWGVFSRSIGFAFFHTSQQTYQPQIIRNLMALLYGSGGPGIHGKFLEDFSVGMGAATIYIAIRTCYTMRDWHQRFQLLSPWLFIGSGLWLALMIRWGEMSASQQAIPLLNWLYGDGKVMFQELGFAIGYGAFLLSILYAGNILTRLFACAPLRWLGLISFSAYLWHIPLLLPFINAVHPWIQQWTPLQVLLLEIVWTLCVIFPFSFVFFILVEQPFMKYSNCLRTRIGNENNGLTTHLKPSDTYSPDE